MSLQSYSTYHTVIKDPEFLHRFTHDYWLGKYQLSSGDDKFLTKWMVSHGWSTYAQCCKEALLSTMKPNWRFFKQVLRRTRNTWRSDMRSLFMERLIWTSHPYARYTMVRSPLSCLLRVTHTLLAGGQTDQPPGPVHGPMLGLIFDVQEHHSPLSKAATICLGGESLIDCSQIHLLDNLVLLRNILPSYLIWLSTTRTAKLLPYLWNCP
jgi:hypothetical protein